MSWDYVLFAKPARPNWVPPLSQVVIFVEALQSGWLGARKSVFINQKLETAELHEVFGAGDLEARMAANDIFEIAWWDVDPNGGSLLHEYIASSETFSDRSGDPADLSLHRPSMSIRMSRLPFVRLDSMWSPAPCRGCGEEVEMGWGHVYRVGPTCPHCLDDISVNAQNTTRFSVEVAVEKYTVEADFARLSPELYYLMCSVFEMRFEQLELHA